MARPLAACAALRDRTDYSLDRRSANERGRATVDRGRSAIMCGIVGYTGKRAAAPLVLEGLKRLEYRGYDSAGLAIVNGGLEVFRTPGKIAALERELGATLPIGTTAIAHTRWATHGVPNTVNAHPHVDCGGTLALVHNGIIENAGALRQALTQRGHVPGGRDRRGAAAGRRCVRHRRDLGARARYARRGAPRVAAARRHRQWRELGCVRCIGG